MRIGIRAFRKRREGEKAKGRRAKGADRRSEVGGQRSEVAERQRRKGDWASEGFQGSRVSEVSEVSRSAFRVPSSA